MLVAYNCVEGAVHTWLYAPSVERHRDVLKEGVYLTEMPFNRVVDAALELCGLRRKDLYVTQAFHLLPRTRSAAAPTADIDLSFDAVMRRQSRPDTSGIFPASPPVYARFPFGGFQAGINGKSLDSQLPTLPRPDPLCVDRERTSARMTDHTSRELETAMIPRRLALSVLGASVGGMALARSPASAQAAYPSRPIRLIIPFAAGGPTDIVARLIAERMAARLGQPVVVDPRPGAGGAIAAEAVARAAPDGHTLLIGTATTHAVNPALQEGRLPFHPIRDFAPIAQIARVPIILVVHADMPARSLQEFIGLVRSRSGGMNYGSSGTGSMGHLAAVLLLQQLGAQATHIPYRGSAPMAADLITGRVEFATDALASVAPLVQDGRIRALAIATPDRAVVLPNVPTFAEAGMPGFEAYTWNVVFASAGTPAPVVGLLNTTLNAVVSEPDVATRLSEMGQPAVTGTTPASTAEFVRAELAKWEPVVRASGATPS